MSGLSLQRRLTAILADLLHRQELTHHLNPAAERLTELSERVQAPVEIANPFARISLDRGVDTPEFRARAAEYAVAMGLAIRRPEDK